MSVESVGERRHSEPREVKEHDEADGSEGVQDTKGKDDNKDEKRSDRDDRPKGHDARDTFEASSEHREDEPPPPPRRTRSDALREADQVLRGQERSECGQMGSTVVRDAVDVNSAE